MKVLIIGLGSIALKHVKVLRELVPDISIYAYRSSKFSTNFENISNLFSLDKVDLYDFDFCIISSPSIFHFEHIQSILPLKIPIFIEKPLFVNKKQIKEFENLNISNIRSYVACNFRFHPIIQFLKNDLKIGLEKVLEVSSYCGSYLPDWRSNVDYRKIYSAREEMGGGVNIDLIHEPDYLVYLFGLPQNSLVFNKKVSSLEINSIDSSIIYFNYKTFQATIKLNYFRRDSKRTLEVVTENDTIFVDFNKGFVFSKLNNKKLFHDKNNLVELSYLNQMKYFLDCLKTNNYKLNSIYEAMSVLKILV